MPLSYVTKMLPICYQNKSVQDEDGSYYNGTLDMSKEGDRMFKEFMDNGGPTGFVTNQNLDKYKKELYRGVRRKDGNMGVQGLELYARNIRKHPIKGVGTMMLKPFMAGAAVALWNMLNGSDGEDGQLYRAFYNDLKAIESVERKVKKAAEGDAKRNAQQKLNEMRRELLKKIDSKRRELRK